jgi:predicted glutamine amidotransferase
MEIIKITQYTFYKERLPENYVFVENGDIEGYIKDYLVYQYDEEKDVYEDFINLLMTTKEETFDTKWFGKTTFELIEVEIIK